MTEIPTLLEKLRNQAFKNAANLDERKQIVAHFDEAIRLARFEREAGEELAASVQRHLDWPSRFAGGECAEVSARMKQALANYQQVTR